MSESSLPKPNFMVCFEPAKCLLRITWQGEVSRQELHDGYCAALEVLKQNPVKNILIDQAKRRIPFEENPGPMFEMLFNEALKLINNTVFLAMVVSPEEFFLSSAAGQFEDYEKMVNHFVIAERFKTSPEAEAWLATIG